jgi:ATP/maltotriose-dependent transcriptional regulator MalT
MDLIEREHFLALLQARLQNIETAEGHCVFVSGEAGIGKTSLVKKFCKNQQDNYKIYQGACDALFTPRPLAPLYDIMWQVNSNLWPGSHTPEERSELFAKFLAELSNQQQRVIIVFEDIHWADEATLDFIKFFARRIALLHCLFILTYREDEIYSGHPLRSVQGHLPPDSFTLLKLSPLSAEAVEKLAAEKGYNGKDVYNISGGNPFYVNEILAGYSVGVPDNIKNAILSTYNSAGEKTRRVWDLLSVVPVSFELKYLEMLEPQYAAAIENCIEKKILIISEGQIFFKHELYRRTVEISLSPFKRVLLNKNILEMFRKSFEKNNEIERIIHHAKNANAYGIVLQYAPLAAKQASAVGAHIEASKLYLTAIENYQGSDKNLPVEFYEGYAYECYLTNQIKEAIIYTAKALNSWKAKKDTDKTGNSLRFLSRLWWFDGNRKRAEDFAEQSIKVLGNQPSSSAKAMAFSNMSHLKMLTGASAEAIFWGEKAIAIAQELNDEEILSHALNNVGSVQMRIQSSSQKGIALLKQSLAIALKNSYHEHVARAYTNLGINGVAIKEYNIAKEAFEEGIRYSKDKDLDSFTTYMLSWNAKLNLETGNWEEACSIAESLVARDVQPPAIKMCAADVIARIKMRRGDAGAIFLLDDSKTKAFELKDLQSIIPSVISLLEYEWITGETVIEKEFFESTLAMVKEMHNFFDYNEFTFWLQKARKQSLPFREIHEGYRVHNKTAAAKAALLWRQRGCPYEEALCLFESTSDDKRKAVNIMHQLGAVAVFEKMKFEMRASGIKNIPRGIRKSTRANAALLTSRELDLLPLLKEGLQNKEIAARLFISAKTVDHHISSILFKLDVNSRNKAVKEALRREIIK